MINIVEVARTLETFIWSIFVALKKLYVRY